MRLISGILMSLAVGAAYANADLTAAIENVRTTCGDIGTELNDMKKMAGISTAVTAVGTVAGGVALGTGIAKSTTDKDIASWRQRLEALIQTELEDVAPQALNEDARAEALEAISNAAATEEPAAESGTGGNTQAVVTTTTDSEVAGLRNAIEGEINELTKKSKKLGNIRTGTLATATATNIAGAVISGTNRVKGDLKTQISECVASVDALRHIRMQAQMDATATNAELAHAESIIRACGAWDTVNVSAINKKSSAASASGGIGAGLGLAGTITSASANKPVAGRSEEKSKSLNTASNVLAGATTVAGGIATIMNATQISAIKHAATVADECEGALK